MTLSTFTVTFEGDRPETLRVGDTLVVSGRAQVKSIDADLVEVTQLGADGNEYLLGHVTIDLYSNRFVVVEGEN